MRWLVSVWMLVGFVACGGEAVIDPDGSGGSSGTSTSSSTSGATSSGSSGCMPGDCPPSAVCVDGICRQSCDGDPFTPCPQGEICDPCATSSCAGCADCVGACVPAPAGRCDDHDDCSNDELCVYSQGICVLECNAFDPNDTTCQAVGQACSPCQTGSCPGCKDCRDVCVPI